MASTQNAPGTSSVTTADNGWYRDITDFAQHTHWLNSAMKLYTLAGLGALALMVAYAWWTARTRRDRVAMAAVAWTGVGSLIAVGCGLALKQVFAESRPCLAMPDVKTLEACPAATDYSFPSDHTTAAVAMAAGLWLISRRLGAVAAVLALIEGFDRVYLGQHYPHDVAAAVVMSAAVLLAGWPLARGPITGLLTRLERTPLRPLLTTAG